MSLRRSSHRTVVLIALAGAFSLFMGGAASAAPGDVDSTFGDGGAKTVAVSGSPNVGGIVQRADGTFVIGDTVGNAAQTVALKRNGQLLGSYGSGGISAVPVPGAVTVTIRDIAKQRDDRVVEAGYDSPVSGSAAFVITRFRTGGAPDTSFSGDGVVKVRFSQGDAYGYGVAVQRDGKIVVVGEIDPPSGGSNPAILRLNPNGSLDRTFGDQGRRMIKAPDAYKGYDAPWRVVVQAHGRLAMAGWVQRPDHSYRTMAMRLMPDGRLDASFGGDGFVIVDVDTVNNYAYGLAEDGAKLVLGTHTSIGEAGFVRLLSDGRRDRAFGGDGIAIHALSVPWEVGAVAVLADHRIVASNNDPGGPEVLQLGKGGKLDMGFGTGGQATGPLTTAGGFDVMITVNRKIVVAGTDSGDVMAARFLGP